MGAFNPPDVLMFLSTHCPHCPSVLTALADLLKRGEIGRLEAINLEVRPDAATTLGVRSVPWLMIGPFELTGAQSPAELAEWARRTGSPDGIAEGFHDLLVIGALEQVQAITTRKPEFLAALLPIMANPEASLNVRIGAGAVFEEQAGSTGLKALIPKLGELSQHDDPRVRADACYTLGLTRDAAARAWLQPRLKDGDADVREIAAESLAALPTD